MLSTAQALLLALSALHPAQSPSVPSARPLELMKVSPALNALAIAPGSTIELHFDQSVDLASFVAPDFHVFGRYSGVTAGTLATSQGGRHVTFTPSQPFAPGENLIVTLSRSVRGSSGGTLGRGFAWSFWIDSDSGSGQYTLTQTLIPGATPYGAYGGDIDSDGDLDLCVPNEDSLDVSVFLNTGTGTFGAKTDYDVGWHCSANEAADFDHDGTIDLAVANIFDDDVSVLLGNGNGTFRPQVRYSVGDQPRGLAVLDADGDGDSDIVTGNRVGSDLSFLRCRDDGTFEPEVRFEGGVSGETGVAAGDMNSDGILDLVVIGYYSSNAAVLFGNGNGAFTLHGTRTLGSSPWQVVVGDVDGDGHADVAAALSGSNQAAISRNNGSGGLLAPSLYAAGSFPIAIDLGDMNGDGYLDLATSAFTGGIFRLRLNTSTGTFGAPTDLPAQQAGSCTVLHDVDGDGDLDVTGIDESADRVFIFRQNG